MSGKHNNNGTVSALCGKQVLGAMIAAIQKNKEYLSRIDGAIGDGDHGINMNKGFTLAESLLASEEELTLSAALEGLGSILFNDIGGSMGPVYGTLFMEMAEVCETSERIDGKVLLDMITAGRKGLQEMGNAQVGDKTLIDTLTAAENYLKESVESGDSFVESLKKMTEGARLGMESTKDMVAKIGRASRLGERSRGILDAGATSCFILLEAMSAELEKSGGTK